MPLRSNLVADQAAAKVMMAMMVLAAFQEVEATRAAGATLAPTTLAVHRMRPAKAVHDVCDGIADIPGFSTGKDWEGGI